MMTTKVGRPRPRTPCLTMTGSGCCYSLRVSLLLLGTISLFCLAWVESSTTASSSVSPIRHLEASLAASSAHGTVVAVRSRQNGQECIVLVTRKSSDTAMMRSSVKYDATQQELFGLHICTETTPWSSRWTPLGTSGVCAMTGFAADAQHLMRVILRQVESHQALYSHAMSVDRIVRALSESLTRAARVQGGRPFGVQVLVVGLDNKGKMQLYTLDPTGGWQHYGGGATAVGRDAADVRTRLHKSIKDGSASSSAADSAAKAALRIAISAMMGDKSVKMDDKSDAHKLEAMLAWKSGSGSCRLARIQDSEVESCYQSIVDKE